MTHGAPAKKNPANDDEEVIPPPDGGWGWAVVFGSFMIHIIGKYTRQKKKFKLSEKIIYPSAGLMSVWALTNL